MLKRYLEQRHINLEHGRSCLALEKVYWDAIESLAEQEGWGTWRDYFYVTFLETLPQGVSLSSHVRKELTQTLLTLAKDKNLPTLRF